MDHLLHDLRHGREDAQRFDIGAMVENRDALGNVLGIVADPFEHGGDLDRRHGFAQIVGQRRTQGDQADCKPLNFRFEMVDPQILFEDAVGGLQIVPGQRVDCIADRRFGQAAHFRNERAQFADIVVECLDRMFTAPGHDWVSV